jgi:hypothetical protein
MGRAGTMGSRPHATGCPIDFLKMEVRDQVKGKETSYAPFIRVCVVSGFYSSTPAQV